MGKPKQLIGLKEYIAIAIFVIGMKSTDHTPAIFFEALKNAGWMIPIISGLIAVLPLYLLLDLATKYEGLSLIHISEPTRRRD